MTLTLIKQTVGPWPMNAYVLICPDTQESAIVDPGAEPERLLGLLSGTAIKCILITHADPDHIGALEAVKTATSAPVYLHPQEVPASGVRYDKPLIDGGSLQLGFTTIRTIHTPGHTPGMITFDIGGDRMLVGDTLFVNGPGRTRSHEDFITTLATLNRIVFRWPDHTQFFPGHGDSGTIGFERSRYKAFLASGWKPGLFGDIAWEE